MDKQRMIALSGWMAYAPFRAAATELSDLGVRIIDGAHDREVGLADGRYSAAPMSVYALVQRLGELGDAVGVAFNTVSPVGQGSDRIVCRVGVRTAEELWRARIGLAADGLEIDLFEHLFDQAGLPVKKDYVILRDRSEYVAAFTERRIDAVMCPQPHRSWLIDHVEDAALFEGDADLPRFGLSAPLVYRRADWTPCALGAVQAVFDGAARKLEQLDDAQLMEAHRGSFEGIAHPAAELRSTLTWPTLQEQVRFQDGDQEGTLLASLRAVASLRARRFGDPAISDRDLSSLVG